MEVCSTNTQNINSVHHKHATNSGQAHHEQCDFFLWSRISEKSSFQEEVVSRLGKFMGIKVLKVLPQGERLDRGSCDAQVVVGTPGKVRFFDVDSSFHTTVATMPTTSRSGPAHRCTLRSHSIFHKQHFSQTLLLLGTVKDWQKDCDSAFP